MQISINLSVLDLIYMKLEKVQTIYVKYFTLYVFLHIYLSDYRGRIGPKHDYFSKNK
jgi:hypothetical protein